MIAHYILLLVILLCLFRRCCDEDGDDFVAVSPGSYRLYDGSIADCSRQVYYINNTVLTFYQRKMGVPRKLKSNDTLVPYADPHPVSSVLNRGVAVCTRDTFLLMLYPIRCRDYRMRALLRRVIPQGVLVNNKTIHRLFIVALDDRNRSEILQIRKERERYGDLLISRHHDSYDLVTLSVWDGFMWVNEHCRQAVYVGKFDPDAVVFLSSLVDRLLPLPRSSFYGGKLYTKTIQPRTELQKWCFPYDYPERRTIPFLSGPAEILSADLIPYLLIGAEYEPMFSISDDVMVASILTRVGFHPTSLGNWSCPFILEDYNERKEYRNISKCVCAYHRVKQYDLYCEIVAYYNITTCEDVSLSFVFYTPSFTAIE